MGVGIVGVAGVAAACGSGSGDKTLTPVNTSSGSSRKSSSSSGSGSTLAKTSQVPVGGGLIFDGPKVVVTQPKAGEFKCFTAVCTHMGCLVGTVANGTIQCPCHGSQYSISTGAVVAGPAPRPLSAESIKIAGGEITLA
jgi:Rieske Fe-S protein